jgi:hypothetical protein
MELWNKTKKVRVAKDVIVRRSVWELVTGLIPYKSRGSKSLLDIVKFKIFEEDQAMLFFAKGDGVVHSFFMSFPIIIAFLDKEMKVVSVEILKPFRVVKCEKEFEYFVELHKSKIKLIDVGDVLLLK